MNQSKIVNTMMAAAGFHHELENYRENRNRPNNKLYYASKICEEAGEVNEVALAIEGSRRKIKKLGGAAGLNEKLTCELGDLVNVAFLLGEHHDIDPADILKAATKKLYEKRTR